MGGMRKIGPNLAFNVSKNSSWDADLSKKTRLPGSFPGSPEPPFWNQNPVFTGQGVFKWPSEATEASVFPLKGYFADGKSSIAERLPASQVGAARADQNNPPIAGPGRSCCSDGTLCEDLAAAVLVTLDGHRVRKLLTVSPWFFSCLA